mmetsp:Transcript_109523/g.353462  ORF Transcript_109523/g.353462 Transcript_109523/m.353462 type:complete len:320 (+) Transcript_109523:749-1708(+)
MAVTNSISTQGLKSTFAVSKSTRLWLWRTRACRSERSRRSSESKKMGESNIFTRFSWPSSFSACSSSDRISAASVPASILKCERKARCCDWSSSSLWRCMICSSLSSFSAFNSSSCVWSVSLSTSAKSNSSKFRVSRSSMVCTPCLCSNGSNSNSRCPCKKAWSTSCRVAPSASSGSGSPSDMNVEAPSVPDQSRWEYPRRRPMVPVLRFARFRAWREAMGQTCVKWSPTLPQRPQRPCSRWVARKTWKRSVRFSFARTSRKPPDGTTISRERCCATMVPILRRVGLTNDCSPTHMPSVKSCLRPRFAVLTTARRPWRM